MARNNGGFDDRAQIQKPHLSLGCSTPGRMWLISVSALLAIIQSGLSDSFYSVFLALVSVLAAVAAEFLFLHRSGKTPALKDGSAVAAALVFTLLLPNRISPVYAVLGIVFAIVVVKHCFGGLGSNWLNPAAGGWLFIRLSWPHAFGAALEASPLSLLTKSLSRGVTGSAREILRTEYAAAFSQSGFLETHVRPFLNNTVFSLFKAELPQGYLDFFASSEPGIIADRGVLALLLGSILLIAFEAGRSWIPLVWVFVFTAFSLLFPVGAAWWKGDLFFILCTGGTLSAAFVLAADPTGSAKSNWCILGTAVAGGFLAWLFRFPGAEPYGAVISVLVINALLLIIRNIENNVLYEKGRPV